MTALEIGAVCFGIEKRCSIEIGLLEIAFMQVSVLKIGPRAVRGKKNPPPNPCTNKCGAAKGRMLEIGALKVGLLEIRPNKIGL